MRFSIFEDRVLDTLGVQIDEIANKILKTIKK